MDDPTVEELASALLLNPTLACGLVRELSEASLAGPWEPTEGSEHGYERVYVRRHVSGLTNVATVGSTATAAVWWTLNTDPEYAGSRLLARAAADAHLVENNWVLAERGRMLDWDQRLSIGETWVRRAHNSEKTALAVVRASKTGTGFDYTIEEFGMTALDRQVRRNGTFNDLGEAKDYIDRVLVDQGWAT